MAYELVNETKRELVRLATAQGVRLDQYFATVAEFDQFVVLTLMRALVEERGLTVDAAYDTVMGAGAYQRLSDDVFAAIQEGVL
jgi:hypothetical protein